MAKAYKCDRCGELYSEPPENVKIDSAGPVTSVYFGDLGNWTSSKKDLCPRCAVDFKIWFEHSNISAQYELQRIEDDLKANAEFAAHNVVKTYVKENNI